jgi:hypothetical protein
MVRVCPVEIECSHGVSNAGLDFANAIKNPDFFPCKNLPHWLSYG